MSLERTMSSFKPAVMLLTLSLLGCSQTHSLTDPVTGLAVSVEGDYLVENEAPQGAYAAMIAVKGRNGHPFIPEETIVPICTAAFQPMPDNAPLTQAEINAGVPQWAAEIEAGMAQVMRFETREPFEFKGISGYKFVASPLGTFSAKMRIVLYVMETPKGRTVLNCSGHAETLAKAMPTYDLIRDGVSPP